MCMNIHALHSKEQLTGLKTKRVNCDLTQVYQLPPEKEHGEIPEEKQHVNNMHVNSR